MKYPSSAWDPGSAGALPAGTAFIGLATVVVGSVATVAEALQPGYEDNVAGVAKVEFRYTPTTLTSASTLAVRSAAGFLHGFYVGAISCPSTVLYDSALPSGSVLGRIACGMPLGFHPFPTSLATGLTVDAIAGSGGVAPFLTFFTRA